MRRTVIGNEFAKMRHLHVGPLAGVLILAVLALAVTSGTTNPDFVPATTGAWTSLLGSLAMAASLVAPLLLAVLASRQVDIEHRGSGWLLSATSGVTRGELCRAKFLTLGLIVATSTVTAVVLVVAVGLLLGITAPLPVGRWLGFTAAVITVNLVVLALQVLLSAHVDNQVVSIGVGLLGTILALFGASVPIWMAHLTPWGYYSLSNPATYHGDDLVASSPAYGSVAALAAVAIVAFGLDTRRLDRQEA